MSKVTTSIYRINKDLDRISGLDGIVADKLLEKEKEVHELVEDILKNYSEANLFNYDENINCFKELLSKYTYDEIAEMFSRVNPMLPEEVRAATSSNALPPNMDREILDSKSIEKENQYITEDDWRILFSNAVLSQIHLQNMTQKEFANKIGVTECTLSNYIRCKRSPGVDTIIRMAKVLGCTTDYLINFDMMVVFKRSMGADNLRKKN